MKNKKYLIGFFILVLIITNVGTFILTNGLNIAFGNKVIVHTDDTNTAKYISKMLFLKDKIEKDYYKDVNEEELLNGAIKGMFEAVGDPYAAYYTKDEFESYISLLKGSYSGIGVVVTQDQDGLITVVSPIDGSPSERAGLETGDKIIKVDNQDVTDMEFEQVVKLIKGDPGTQVTLTILREGHEKLFVKEIIREEIKLSSVRSEIINDNIGYIKIIQFDNEAPKLFKEQLSKLMEKEIEALIIDLRDNPGGTLESVSEIADTVLGKTVIVYTENKKQEREYKYSDEKEKIDIPLAVLVNKGTASASEILSGAVQDTHFGTIVGTTTFGKGIVQRLVDMGDGTGYKFTVSEYFTPNGVNIHGKGIEPDVYIEMPKDIIESTNNDSQLQKAIEIISAKLE